MAKEYASTPNSEGTIGVSDLLREARTGPPRPSPGEALRRQRRGAVLIDIRSDSQIAAEGLIPGATVIARNVLEWRLDPSSQDRIPQLADRRLHLILVCRQGYQSSLAAANLRRFGLDATDVDGGFEAWRAAGLPVEPPPAQP